MKIRHFILTASFAFAILTTSAWSITLPPTDDTYSVLTFTGKPPTVTKTSIASSSGASASLPVSKKNDAFIQFNVGGTGIAPASVAKATLTLYFPMVTKAGDLDLSVVTQDWAEKFTGPAKAQPTFAPSFQTIPAGQVVAKQFVVVDVTSQVKAWLTTPGADFGFALSAASDGLANARIAAKEGPGLGYPAEIQIETNPEVDTNGNFLVPTGSVGIGTLNPTAPLDVTLSASPVASGGSFDSSISLRLTNTDATGTTATPAAVGIAFGATTTRQAIVGGTFGNDFLNFFTSGDLVNPKLAIDFAGNVGIGTAAPHHMLDVRGNVLIGTQNPNEVFTELGDTIYLGSGRKYLSNTLGAPVAGNTDWMNLMGHPFSAGILFGTSGPSDSDVHSAPNPLMVIRSGGNVGIGTVVPNVKLAVRGNILMGTQNFDHVFTPLNDTIYLGSARKYLSNTLGAPVAGNTDWMNLMCHPLSGGILFGTSGPSDDDGQSAPNALMVIQSGGNVGIGTATPGTKLEVNGGIKCVGAVNTSSDARYKMNIQPLSGALGQTLRLRAVSYDWNRAKFPEKGFNDRRQIGFIAQEVREILPDVVSEDQDGYLSIGYTAIIPVLTEAIKEQQSRIDALKSENAALAAKVDGLAARDREREARLARLESAMEDSKARVVPASIEFK